MFVPSMDTFFLITTVFTEFCLFLVDGGATRRREVTYEIPSRDYQGLWTVAPCVGPTGCGVSFNDSEPLGSQLILEKDSEEVPCIAQGYFNQPINWHGYLVQANMSAKHGRIYYHITYPEEKCCIKLLLYRRKQVRQLRAKTMSCLQRQAVLPINQNQVISLSPHSMNSGCTRNITKDGRRVIECTSGLVLNTSREMNWNLAVSSCGSPTGLDFEYSIVLYGHTGCDNGVPDVSASLWLPVQTPLVIVLMVTLAVVDWR